jgi:hypothetical protein
VTENGDLCYNISYPKAKKGTEAMVKPRKGPPTYGNFLHFLEDPSPKKPIKYGTHTVLVIGLYELLDPTT